jgi:hypothetical protein
MTIPIGTQVRCYWNFHRKLFSVQVKGEKGWRVAGHARNIRLENVRFKVNEAGRERVLRERKKNVHAMIHGTICAQRLVDGNGGFYVSYNPYYLNRFYTHMNHEDRKISLGVVDSAAYLVLWVAHDRTPRIFAKDVS